jgi:uncharacterized protein (DUF433 family)
MGKKARQMIPNSPTLTIPLQADEHGSIRVSGTRVTLDTIIARYHQGDTPETIHEGFDVVPITDIYAVIAYYLGHRDELDAYLKRRQEEADRIRQEIEANYTPQQRDLHERLRLLAEKKRHERGS